MSSLHKNPIIQELAFVFAFWTAEVAFVIDPKTPRSERNHKSKPPNIISFPRGIIVALLPKVLGPTVEAT